LPDTTGKLPVGDFRPPSAPTQTSASDLDRVLVRGIAWTTTAKWISQVVSWAITLVVARLLSPSDYGLVGMATLALGFVTLFSEFGLGTTVVTLRDTSDEHISQLNTISVLMGLFGFLLSLGIAVPLSRFFRAQPLRMIIVVMGLSFLISSLRVIPSSLLQKEMRFKTLAIIDALQSGITAIVTLVLAALGFGYWALVLGNVSMSVAVTTLTLFCKRQRFVWPTYSELRGPLLFSWHIIVGRLSWFAYDNSDFTIAGRVLGEAPLGAYTLAWTIAHTPLEKLTVLVNRVTPSFFASIQSDLPALRRYLLNISRALALVVYPATVGLSLVANQFVTLALGAKWHNAVIPLQLLAFHALLRSNVILLTPVINAIGEARFSMWQSVASALVLPISFYLASYWGTAGIAGVWVLVYPFLQIPLYWRLFQRIRMSLWEYLAAMWPAASGCLVMAAVVEGLKWWQNSSQTSYFRLATQMFVGVLTYLLVLLVGHRRTVSGMLKLARNLRAESEQSIA
jgi:O-antigen/teichoic acid export membrane protein